ncbi:MAG: hypothetical protein PHT07_10085 [Paludibacter sp.]|nr:hypothetical protein [Paludibacter sp.]
MAKGLKMFSARDKQLGTIYKIKEVNPEKHGDFICEDCGVDIKYTRAHMRASSNEEVGAYFSLKPNIDHGECKYNITIAIQKIINHSQSVEGAEPLISTESDGTHIFRLNFLEKAIKQITPFVDKKGYGKNKVQDKAPNIGKDYVLTEKQIASYLSSAAGVTKIKSMIEHQADDTLFKKTVRINYKDKNIQWGDFYFERNDYPKLYESKHIYPIAIEVLVIDNKIYSNRRGCSVRCYAQSKKEDNKTVLYSVFLHFNDQNLANQINPDTAYIVLGKIWYPDIQHDDAKKITYKTMNIDIHNWNQILEIEN